MAKSIVTPADLREFATILQKNIDEFTLIENSMNQKLNSYEWQDVVAMKFKADFEATKEPLNKLRLKMEEFIPHLTRKADVLEEGYMGDTPSMAAFKSSMAAFAGVGVGSALMGDSPSISALKKGIQDTKEGNSKGDTPSIEALKRGIAATNFDISKATDHLKDNAKEKSVGQCAKYVREALGAGGIEITDTIPKDNEYGQSFPDAKDYKTVLPNYGYASIGQSTKENKDPKIEYKAGDIVVFDSFGKHTDGHIQMCNYDEKEKRCQWISDFKQKNFYPFLDTEGYNHEYTVFRI